MSKFKRLISGITTTALAGVVLAVGAPPAMADDITPPDFAYLNDTPLAGANDWSCTPDATHPRPVVLLHGTGMNMTNTWQTLAPRLAEGGACVFALNYGGALDIFNPDEIHWGVTDISESARQVAGFVDTVLERTGASQVDIVGHSQGGVVARQYLKFEGGADPEAPANNKVHSLVMLGASNHGASFGYLQALAHQLGELFQTPEVVFIRGLLGPAAVQQLHGSGFLAALNRGSQTQPGVDYTSIASRNDGAITPPESSFLEAGPSATVDNVLLQDGCPSNTADHIALLNDVRSLYLVQSALDPESFPRAETPCEGT